MVMYDCEKSLLNESYSWSNSAVLLASCVLVFFINILWFFLNISCHSSFMRRIVMRYRHQWCSIVLLIFTLGLLCDLLWSDPDKDVQGWGENDRGVSFTFGADVVSKFLNRHDLDLICRAHQVSIHVIIHFLKNGNFTISQPKFISAN